MKKILHIITGLNRGGAETTLYRFISQTIADEMYEHEVVSLAGVGYFTQEIGNLGVKVHSLKLRSVFDLPLVILNVKKIVRKSNADVVQTWLYHGDLLGGGVAKIFSGLPVVWWVHTVQLDPSSSYTTKITRFLCAKLSNTIPSKVIYAAQASAEFHQKIGYPQDKIIVAPNGFDLKMIAIDHSRSKMLREGLGINKDEVVIGSIGRFHPDKDYCNLIKAAGILKDKDINFKVLLVGEGLISNNEELMGFLRSNNLCDKFLAIGPRDDIGICLGAMDIFCLPSRTEAFPLVIGEAMAAAKAIVATNVGDVAYIVGDTGFVVPHSDEYQLAEALEQVIGMSVEERSSLGNLAKARVLTEFSMENFIQKIRQVYHEVIRER